MSPPVHSVSSRQLSYPPIPDLATWIWFGSSSSCRGGHGSGRLEIHIHACPSKIKRLGDPFFHFRRLCRPPPFPVPNTHRSRSIRRLQHVRSRPIRALPYSSRCPISQFEPRPFPRQRPFVGPLVHVWPPATLLFPALFTRLHICRGKHPPAIPLRSSALCSSRLQHGARSDVQPHADRLPHPLSRI